MGSSHMGGALLGSKELERLFPERKMRVFVGEFNKRTVSGVHYCSVCDRVCGVVCRHVEHGGSETHSFKFDRVRSSQNT